MEAAALRAAPDGFSADTLHRILKGSIAAGASDIHLRVGHAPVVRMQGELRPLDHPALTDRFVEDSKALLGGYAAADASRLSRVQGNFACEVPDVARFRVHFYQQQGSTALVLRWIPNPIPGFVELRIPPVVKRVVNAERGLVLVTGATGNGKSTTIASMLALLNQERSKHVVTIEEPIEYIFDEHRATFSQREIGRDVESVQAGLLGALREDPDWIFVGEIRTHEEFEVALSAAEAGHVVLTTLHSQDTARAIQRMVHFYPEGRRDSARERIADALTAVVAQRLVHRRGARERVLVTEVLRRTPTVQDCIRDESRFRALGQALEAGTSEYGTHTFDQMLLSLARDGVITPDSARAAATNPNDLVRTLKLGGKRF